MMRSLSHFVYFFWVISMVGILHSCIPKEPKKEDNAAFEKSPSGQIYQWSEEEGLEFLKNAKASYTTPDEWEKRAEVIRKHILKTVGLDPLPKKCELKPIIGESRIYNGYQVQNVAFESLPGVFVTGSIYKPVHIEEKLPGILSPHGHWPEREDYGRYRVDVQKRCAAMARMGAIVFTYDMVGYGQLATFGWKHKHPKTMKLSIWNSIRAVDFLLTQGIDSMKIACTGASGGGTQTFHLTAVDNRVTISVPVVMVSYRHFGGCVCELGMPIHEKEGFKTNNVEIASCIAPNPLMLVSVGTDATLSTPVVEFPHIKYLYGLFGKADNVENVHLPGDKHGYDENKRAAVYPFLAKHMDLDLTKAMNSDGSLREDDIVIEEIETLYTFNIDQPFPGYGIRNNDEVYWEY